MPLAKKALITQPQAMPPAESAGQVATPAIELQAQIAQPATTAPAKKLGGLHKSGDKAAAPMTKDDYWCRREEREIARDKHMGWSGLAQAALGSVLVAQLNTDNTEDGLIKLVVRITEKLLQARDSR